MRVRGTVVSWSFAGVFSLLSLSNTSEESSLSEGTVWNVLDSCLNLSSGTSGDLSGGSKFNSVGGGYAQESGGK